MSEFWKKKMRKYFSTFDLDGDGIMSKRDWVGMAIRFSRIGNADKQKAKHLKKLFEDVWAEFVKKADIGDRDALTQDEFVSSMAKQRYSPELMKPFRLMVICFHDVLDVSGDSYLQDEEYERILVLLGVPDTSFVKKAFASIDVDGDGKLSIEEFTDAFFDFLFSEDEKSPNTYYFGPLDD